MNPIQKFIKNLFAKKRIVGDYAHLEGFIKADTMLNDLVVYKKVPGISITVLKEGKLCYQKGIGYADLEKKTSINTGKTLFRVASVSKPIAATALAHMVKKGSIDLDASFYKYVPYYPKKKWDFTIRQLANHTAGIRGYKGIEYGLNRPYSIKESIAIFKDDDLLFEPGTDYMYNSYGWVLISLAIQEVSGEPFEDYVKQYVLQPLGLTHTVSPNRLVIQEAYDAQFQNEYASFYSKKSKGFRKAISVNNFFKLAGGGYLSTSEDIANFGQAVLNGKLSELGLTKQFLTSEIIAEKKTYYGLGWQVSKDQKGRLFYGHIGNGVGGYANFFVYPHEQMVFAILINCTNPNVQIELDEVISVFLNTFGGKNINRNLNLNHRA